MLNFAWYSWKYLWDGTDDEIYLWIYKIQNFEFYFLSFPWQTVIKYIFSFKKM